MGLKGGWMWGTRTRQALSDDLITLGMMMMMVVVGRSETASGAGGKRVEMNKWAAVDGEDGQEVANGAKGRWIDVWSRREEWWK